jgi:hypothetical protein
MCYRVKAVRQPPPPRHVEVPGLFVNSQLGPDRVDAVSRRALRAVHEDPALTGDPPCRAARL